MAIRVRIGAAAMVLVMAGGIAMTPAEPVQAQGLFEFLFDSRRTQERRRQEELRRRLDTVEVRISSPKYFTYLPDELRTVSLADLATAASPAGKTPVQETASADGQSAAASGAAGEGASGETAAPPAGAANEPPAATTGAAAEPASKEPVVPALASPFGAARGHLTAMKVRALPEVGDAIIAHYREHPRFIWIADGDVNAKARAALAALQGADAYGLNADEYQVNLPGDITAATGAASGERERALMEFEMQLSAKVLTYVLDATRGRVDPNRISGYHDLPRKEVDLAEALKIVSNTDDVGAYLDSRHPDSQQFRALVAELAALRGKDDEERVEVSPDTFLKPGGSDPELANVVAAIRLRGSEALKVQHAATLSAYQGEADYSPELVELVRDFQRENKLHPDGIIGRNTVSALTSLSNADKIRKVRIALEQMRWLPHQLGSRYVFVNQPAFTATFVRGEQEPVSMRVVVGTKANQTSFFYDEIETVEYNPYWGVPLSIIVNEMLPELSKDPGYLDRIGYEVTTASGQRVSSSSVDWFGVATKAVPINVRQLPGRGNALGELKILFPNKHDIYMHDTPAKNLFQRDRRAFSHGCIRLQDPRGMAAALLGKSTDYVVSRIAQGKNDSDPVPGNIPVYVSYFTAWPTLEGTVEYFDDVYDRDMHLTRAMDATRKARLPES